MARAAPMFLLLLVAPLASQAVELRQREAARVSANPVRKVVTMLQNMQAKVKAEGEKEEALYEKFMCYCKGGMAQLEAGIAAAETKIEAVTGGLKETAEKKAQMEASLKKNQGSRADAKSAMAEATALREKEAGVYADLKEESDTNIAALGKAISAVEGGMGGGSFLQSAAANVVRRYALDKAEMADTTRQELLAFLSGTQGEGYAPASGEIVGILKQMNDDMSKALADATAEEKASVGSFDSLMASKKKEVEALSAQIEEEMMRVGELGVKLAEMEHDLKDTKEGLAEDSKFVATLKTDCKTKTAEWEAIQKTRAEELVALADTIKILNDDDALELFKKTLPGASASFVQVQVSSSAMRSRALASIRGIVRGQHLPAQPQLDLIALAISGKKVGFEKVIKLIDNMMVTLKKEQQDDDDKKEYCEEQFDITEDKKKGLEVSISDSETAIDDLKGSIATLKEEIDALEDGIRALDKSVAEATKQRKEENTEFTTTLANNGAAKEILLFAKNRLNKFYNPKLYKEMPKPGEAMLLAQLQGKAPLGPPPEAPGPYQKKTEESQGVIGMIDLLVKDLDKDMQESKVSEKDAQEDYEALMKESGEKRAQDAKSVTDKSASLAAAEEGLEQEGEKKAGSEEELKATKFYLSSLHNECDWLIKYYDMRKTARTTEIEALESAKGVLSGADFSLLQTGRAAHAKGFLGVRL